MAEAAPRIAAEGDDEIRTLNERFEGRSAELVLRWATETFAPDVVLTCSFQHEGVALAHMVRRIAPTIPVLFIDTGFHFPQTLEYVDEITRRFDLNLRVLRPTMTREQFDRAHGLDLYRRDPDLCCAINKVAPLRKALQGVRCWINGRRRDQSALRRNIAMIERYEGGVYKVNPLLHWMSKDTHRYLADYDIPTHPLFEKGYASIGCAPCTRPILAGEDERAGRWSGTAKSECGIHTLLKPA